jgi:hypothetical protein
VAPFIPRLEMQAALHRDHGLAPGRFHRELFEFR